MPLLTDTLLPVFNGLEGSTSRGKVCMYISNGFFFRHFFLIMLVLQPFLIAENMWPRGCVLDCQRGRHRAVCGSNGRLYKSLCAFQRAQCINAQLRPAPRARCSGTHLRPSTPPDDDDAPPVDHTLTGQTLLCV